MINDKELKFLQQVAGAITNSFSENEIDKTNPAYERVLNSLINKYIDIVKDEQRTND
jgi:hypothetical protein